MSNHDKAHAASTAAAAGKETFWKRSRRTLGDKYFAFLKESAAPSPIATTSVPGQESKDSSSDLHRHSEAYARRREQIRRSQRTHRARTEKYVIGLEEEVGRLRLAHADCVALVKTLQYQLSQAVPQTEHLGTIAEVNLLSKADGSIEEVSGIRDPHYTEGFAHAQGHTDPILDSTLGLEFVIRLEEPCLNYVRQDLAASQDHPDSNSNISDGSPPCNMLSRITPEHAALNLNADTAAADRLLALSSRLDLGDDQITPIQAWESIKSHPKAHFLTAGDIRDILTRAQALLTCHRHGAALNKLGFEALLDDILDKRLLSV